MARQALITRVLAEAAQQTAHRAGRVEPRCGRTRVVAVDGPSGAGKTSLTEATRALLVARAVTVAVVRMDDLYYGWTGLAGAIPALVRTVLVPLSRGVPGRFRRYDWTSGQQQRWQVVPVVDWLLVEGSGCGATPCRPFLSCLTWVETDATTRYARAIARDGDRYRPHWDQWARQERAYLARHRTRGHAHVVWRS